MGLASGYERAWQHESHLESHLESQRSATKAHSQLQSWKACQAQADAHSGTKRPWKASQTQKEAQGSLGYVVLEGYCPRGSIWREQQQLSLVTRKEKRVAADEGSDEGAGRT